MIRPQPKFFDANKFSKIKEASAAQTGRVAQPKSTDPNFPVFETPINQKLLVYVPNHVEVTEEGDMLRMDKGAIHQVFNRNSFGAYRCTNGVIAEEDGYNGTCPLCDALGETWELYRLQYAQEAKKRGLDIQNDHDALQPARSELLKNMAVKGGEIWLTFPIVVVETDENKLIPKANPDGSFNVKPYFFQIRETTYNEKWVSSLDSIPDSPSHPGGHWFILDYTYQSKSGKHDKRGSANALKINYKALGDKFSQLSQFCDQITSEFTPQKATEVIYANMFYDLADLQKVTDDVMSSTRERLAVYAAASTGGLVPTTATAGSPEDIASSFGATPVNEVGVEPDSTDDI